MRQELEYWRQDAETIDETVQYFTEPVFRDGRGVAVRYAMPRVEAEAGAQEELREVLAGQHVSTISIMWSIDIQITISGRRTRLCQSPCVIHFYCR